MIFNDKVYSFLKLFVAYILPASGTFYFTLTSIWGLPYGQETLGTISALTIFLNVILAISSSAYKSSGADTHGTLQIDTSDPNKDIYRLQVKDDVSTLADKNRVVFAVDKDAKLS
jgi:hypothetical protein